MKDKGLVYVGRIQQLVPIANADKLERAEVVCGEGGKWWSVVGKENGYKAGDHVLVYMQDTIVPKTNPYFDWMEKYGYRVKMQKLRGAPSEVLLAPVSLLPKSLGPSESYRVGEDVTIFAGVDKYEKPIPASLQGIVKGSFPTWIPKTDEPNFQKAPHLLKAMIDQEVYITEKCDGSSMTVYKREGVFGVCSRNLDLKEGNNLFWEQARYWQLEKNLPEGFVLQGELCGPGIQKNPMQLAEPAFLVFNGFEIGKGYMNALDLFKLCVDMKINSVPILSMTKCVTDDGDFWRQFAEGKSVTCDSPREGIVVRPMIEQQLDGERVSVKALNLEYKG